MSKDNSITLKQYIEARGVHNVAALCRVTSAAVYAWSKMQTPPVPLCAYLMIEDSIGMLSFNSIYGQYIHANFKLVSDHRAKDFRPTQNPQEF
jgi:hypothetical protein